MCIGLRAFINTLHYVYTASTMPRDNFYFCMKYLPIERLCPPQSYRKTVTLSVMSFCQLCYNLVGHVNCVKTLSNISTCLLCYKLVGHVNLSTSQLCQSLIKYVNLSTVLYLNLSTISTYQMCHNLVCLVILSTVIQPCRPFLPVNCDKPCRPCHSTCQL